MTLANIATATYLTPAFATGMALSLSLIVAIGPQNAHVIRMGLLRQHLWLTVVVTVLTDVVLIGMGVGVLAALGGLPQWLIAGMTAAGAAVLCIYGWRALRRFLQSSSKGPGGIDAAAAPITRRQAVSSALALSFLNPHAWLDTAVLIGTASLAYARPDNAVFGVGAATGSLLWFVVLGAALALVGRRMQSPAMWRALDAVVALTMWGCALWLLTGLIPKT